MNTSDFVSGAPRYITTRFHSLKKYVWSTIYPTDRLKIHLSSFTEIGARKDELERLKAICDEAATLLFIFWMNKFFKEGAKAAKEAVDTFSELGVDGFYIGTSYYSGRNNKVMEGENLANKLLESIADPSLREIIMTSNYMSEILYKYHSVI